MPDPSLSDGRSGINLTHIRHDEGKHPGCRYRTECRLVIMRCHAYFGALKLKNGPKIGQEPESS